MAKFVWKDQIVAKHWEIMTILIKNKYKPSH